MDIEKYIRETRGYYITDEHYKYNNLYDGLCCNRLNSVPWSKRWIQNKSKYNNLYEVRFKNGRKSIYKNTEDIFLKVGDLVVVEAQIGYDVGIVNQFGEQIYFQILKYTKLYEIPQIFRKAKASDIEKWKKSIIKEEEIFKKAKVIIENMGLIMKLNDVEVQGDGTKVTFYYTADDRVDFRELIKVFASEFKMRIEMKQIGARQEAARIGGIGSCGRELCCTNWKSLFESVTTNAARYQELSLNPSKLAGQCGKLKCCLNYEIDLYIETKKNFPDTSIVLKTKQGDAYYQKCDIFKKLYWYSFDPENSVNITAISIERVEEIIELNKNGVIPDTLEFNNLETKQLISSKHNIKFIDDNNFYSHDVNESSQKKNRKNK